MHYVNISLFMLFFSQTGFSQISDTLLLIYKNQDLKLNQLDLSGKLGGSS